MAEDVLALRELERAAVCGGGQARQRRQQRLGRMLARDRIAALVDSDSFVEHGMLVRGTGGAAAREKPAWGDGVVTGLGRVGGRPVAIYAHDATVLRGALGSAGAQKIVSILGLAREHGIPVVAIHDSDGVRVGEGAPALAGFARVLGETARLSGWVPQIGVVLGLCVGGSAYSSALHDVVIGCSGQGFLFVTGAKVTQVVTREQTPIDELGGVEMHAARTGLVHLRHESEAECLGLARSVLSYLPQNARQAPPQASPDDPVDRPTNALEKLIPEDPRWAYDMRRVVTEIFDRDSVLELQPGYAGSIIVALARLGGRAVGVVASQPMVNAGALDCDSSRKAARLHPDVQQLRPAHHHVGGRSRLSARASAGAGRPALARRQAHRGLRRVHGAAHLAHRAQELTAAAMFWPTRAIFAWPIPMPGPRPWGSMQPWQWPVTPALAL